MSHHDHHHDDHCHDDHCHDDHSHDDHCHGDHSHDDHCHGDHSHDDHCGCGCGCHDHDAEEVANLEELTSALQEVEEGYAKACKRFKSGEKNETLDEIYGYVFQKASLFEYMNRHEEMTKTMLDFIDLIKDDAEIEENRRLSAAGDVYLFLGNQSYEDEECEDALEWYEKAGRSYAPVAATGDSQARLDMAGIKASEAQTLFALGRNKEAVAKASPAIDELKQLAEVSGDDAFMDSVYGMLGNVLTTKADALADATSYGLCQEAAVWRRKVRNPQPDDLAELTSGLLDLYQNGPADRPLAESIALLQEALPLMERFAVAVGASEEDCGIPEFRSVLDALLAQQAESEAAKE